jgi:SAM-dependent methyltransferase
MSAITRRGLRTRIVRSVRRPRWGNLKRLEPFSIDGYSRGTPLDRVYIERFLSDHARDIRGRVLEVRDATYTKQFGGSQVYASEVLDRDAANPAMTVHADLCVPDALPAESFDCFILTHTLQLLMEPDVAVANAFRALKSSGVLLVAVPVSGRVIVDPSEEDRWRFTPLGLSTLLGRSFPAASITITSRGSLVTALGALLGLAAEDLSKTDLRHDDARFATMAFARAVKP